MSELDDMVSSAIEAAIETSPEFSHGWRSMSDKELIPEILDEIPIEYTEKDVAEAIYRYKVRRLTKDPAPAQNRRVMEDATCIVKDAFEDVGHEVGGTFARKIASSVLALVTPPPAPNVEAGDILARVFEALYHAQPDFIRSPEWQPLEQRAWSFMRSVYPELEIKWASPAPVPNLEPLGTVVGLIDWNGATASVINAELPARSPVYGVPPATASVVMVPQSAIDWLLGEGPDAAGSHFGDYIPERAPRYWWRSHFRELIAAPQPNVLAPVDAKERKE